MTKILCKKCGSDEVIATANTSWSVKLQEWKIEDVLDDRYCMACEDECRTTEEDL